MSDDLDGQIHELRSLGRGARTERTLLHVCFNPTLDLTPEQREEAERLFFAKHDTEFGLEDAAYAEVRHLKHGRWHTHRVYDATSCGPRIVDLGHDYARRQRISAEVAFAMGLPCPPIAHPGKIMNALKRMGLSEIAQHVDDTWRAEKRLADAKAAQNFASPLVLVSAADADFIAAPITPKERMQQNRTGVRKSDVGASILTAWDSSDDGPSFVAAIRAQGLPVGMGDKGPIVLDQGGGTHGVGRLLAAALKAAGRDSKGMAARATARLAGVELAPLAALRELPRAIPVQAVEVETPPAPAPLAALLPDLSEAPGAILVDVPDLVAGNPSPDGEEISINEIAEFIFAHEVKQKAEKIEKTRKAAIQAVAREAEVIEPQQTTVATPPVVRQNTPKAPGILESPLSFRNQRTQASDRFSPSDLRRALADRATAMAALERDWREANAAMKPAFEKAALAHGAFRKAQEEASKARRNAGAAWERAKIQPLETQVKQAEIAYTEALDDLHRHEETASGVNSWKRYPALNRAWTETRTYLQSVADKARTVLEEARAALRSLHTWLTQPPGQQERAKVETEAHEAIVRPLREEAEARDAEKVRAEEQVVRAREALEEARAERTLALRRFRSVDNALYSAPKPDEGGGSSGGGKPS